MLVRDAMLIQVVITIIFVAVVCMIDFSVFFLKENTEKLLYYDETVEEYEQPSADDAVNGSVLADADEVVSTNASTNETCDDFVDDFEDVPSEDIDVAALARDLVRDVQEDAKRDG